MRVKYSFTTDLKDVPSGVHFHLSKYLGKHSVDNNLKRLMDLMRRGDLNFSLISKDIGKLREQLGKLDILLNEASTILEACNKFENGSVEEAREEPKPVQAPPPANRPAIKKEEPPPRPTARNTNSYEKHEQIENNMAQLGNLVETLNKMRGPDWDSSTE